MAVTTMSEVRACVDVPAGWETVQAADEIAAYGLIRPKRTTHVHLLVVRTSAELSAAPAAILEERLRALSARNDVKAHEPDWGTWMIAGEPHPSVRCRLDSPRGPHILEETCVRRGTDLVVLQIQYDVDRTSAAHLDQLIRIRDGLMLPAGHETSAPKKAPAHSNVRRDGRDAAESAAPLWRLLHRSVHARLSEPDLAIDVAYEVRARNISGGSLDRIGFVLLHPSMAEIRSVRLDDRDRLAEAGDEAGAVQVRINPPLEPRRESTLRLEYRLHFERINAWMPATRRLHFDADEVACATQEWLPRLIVRGKGGGAEGSPRTGNAGVPDARWDGADSLEAAGDAKCPFHVAVDAPSAYRVFGSGRVLDRQEDLDRTRYVFSNGNSATPFINFVAQRSAPPRSTDGVAWGPGRREKALRGTIRKGVALLTAWLGPVSLADDISLVFYGGDQCLGLGPLLLIGRFFERAESSIDRPVAGLFTLREMVLHELSHLWFGGVATARGGDARYLHELFAHLLTLRMAGHIRGRKAQADLARRLTELSSGRHPDAPGDAVALHDMRNRGDAAAFDAAIRRCFLDHRGRTFDRADVAGLLSPLGDVSGWFSA